jgi:hypothetical protein
MSGSTSRYLRNLISFQADPIMKRVYKRLKKRYTKLPHNKKHLIKSYINL